MFARVPHNIMFENHPSLILFFALYVLCAEASTTQFLDPVMAVPMASRMSLPMHHIIQASAPPQRRDNNHRSNGPNHFLPPRLVGCH